MQPTDFRVWSVFVFQVDTEAARRNERGTGNVHQGLVVQIAREITMRSRVFQILMALGSVAALALAGGASIKGY
ncbi:MAG TPA: hypothetical protein VGM51_17575 [Armatimonadota bacterium]